MRKKQPTIYAFIDSQNLNLAIREQGWALDFKKIRVYLTEKFHVQKAILFLGYIRKYQKMYDHLRLCGFKIVFKPILERKREKIKGNIDAELVLHTMIEYPKYSGAVIVTGDGDFHCLVEYLTKKKKLKALLIPNKHKYSALLRKFGKYIIFLSDQRNKIGQTKREPLV